MNKHTGLVTRIGKVLLVTTALFFSGIFNSGVATAASITAFSDTMSRLQASTASNHTLSFVTPTGVTAGQTITVTFSAAFTGVSSIVFGDIDVTDNASNLTLAATPSGATWGAASSGQVVTITSGTGTITAGHTITILIGTNATFGTTGTHQISNGSAGTGTVAIGGTFADSGTLAVPIISNDQVAVSATVDPTITMTISANTMQFGTLTTANARFANGSGGTTTEAGSGHTIAVGTNASSGYILTVQGATLTSGSNTITAIGGTAATSSVGTEQYGIRLTASGGSGTVTAPYNDATPKWAYSGTSTTASQVASAAGTSATTTYTVTYIANIASNTESGNYSTTQTYIATSSF